MSKRKLEATRENQARKQVKGGNRRLPPGAKVQSRRRVPWLWIGVAAAVIVVAAGVVAFAATRGGGSSNAAPKTIAWSQLQGLQTGPAPWTPGIDGLTQRIGVLNLAHPAGTHEPRDEHGGVRQVKLAGRVAAVGRRDPEVSTAVTIQQRREHARRVEPREAEPVEFAVIRY